MKKLERSLHDEFQTVIALEDGTELTMDIRELFDLVVRWNTLPFKEQSDHRLTKDDVE